MSPVPLSNAVFAHWNNSWRTQQFPGESASGVSSGPSQFTACLRQGTAQQWPLTSLLGRWCHGRHLGDAHWALWLGFGHLLAVPPVRLRLCGLLLHFPVFGVGKSDRDSFVSLVKKGSGAVFRGGAWEEAAVSPGTQGG